MSTTTEELIQQAIRAARTGDKAEAKKILAQVVKQEPQNAHAWYLLSQVVERREQAKYCLEQVLKIQPANQQAQERLAGLKGSASPKIEVISKSPSAASTLTATPKNKTKTRKEKKRLALPVYIAGAVAGLCIVCILGSVVMGQLGLLSTDTPAPTSPPISMDTPTAVIPPKLLEIPTDTPALLPIDATGSRPACISPNAPSETGLVTGITDGDTIEVLINGQSFKVRYIGIDTPETKYPGRPVDYYGPEAEAKNRELVDGKTIILVKDVSETDQYGRLLRYIFIDNISGLFVNYELVRLGYAHASAYPPDISCDDYFRQAEQEARNSLAGLWGPTPIPSLTAIVQATASSPVSIVISNIFFDGNVAQVESDEYAEITNQGTTTMNMKGWRLNAGADKQDFYFPDFVLEPGQSCRVYTNEIHPDSCGGQSFESAQPVWGNNGDCGYLYDANGVEVSKKCY